jgi:hypothetical protein
LQGLGRGVALQIAQHRIQAFDLLLLTNSGRLQLRATLLLGLGNLFGVLIRTPFILPSDLDPTPSKKRRMKEAVVQEGAPSPLHARTALPPRLSSAGGCVTALVPKLTAFGRCWGAQPLEPQVKLARPRSDRNPGNTSAALGPPAPEGVALRSALLVPAVGASGRWRSRNFSMTAASTPTTPRPK